MLYKEVDNKIHMMWGDIICEGKTKVIYKLLKFKEAGIPEDITDVVSMLFKDDITAGDGVKHDVIQGKALVDWGVNKDIFEYLNKKGIPTHYIESLIEKESIVKALDKKINLEVVSRRIATGSILKHTSYTEGQVFRPLMNQFYYKDDFLHDPLLEDKFLNHLAENKYCYLFREMIALNVSIFCALEEAFAQFKLQLIDMKLEYGIINNEVVLIDEITPSSFRLWPYKYDTIDLSARNVLDQLDPNGRLDKDLYRKEEADLEGVKNKFQIVADITSRFKELEI